VKAAEAALRTEKVQVETEKERARERTAADRKAAAELQQERAASFRKCPPPRCNDTSGHARRAGESPGRSGGGRCNVCQMALRLQYFQDLKKDVEILSCESCSAAVLQSPVAVEDLTRAAPAVQDR